MDDKPIIDIEKSDLTEVNKIIYTIKVKNLETNVISNFSSIRKACKFINKYHAYVTTKCINIKGFYKNNHYYLRKESY